MKDFSIDFMSYIRQLSNDEMRTFISGLFMMLLTNFSIMMFLSKHDVNLFFVCMIFVCMYVSYGNKII